MLQAHLTQPAPQPHDVGPDLGVGEPRVLPGERGELLAREGAPGVAEEEVEQVGLPPGQTEGLAGVGERVVLGVDHHPGQFGVAVAPGGEPVFDPGEVSLQFARFGASVGARDHRAEDRRQFLVDRDPSRHLWQGGSCQILARKLAPIAPRIAQDPCLHT